jgi:hypothetical protein
MLDIIVKMKHLIHTTLLQTNTEVSPILAKYVPFNPRIAQVLSDIATIFVLHPGDFKLLHLNVSWFVIYSFYSLVSSTDASIAEQNILNSNQLTPLRAFNDSR